MRPRVPDPIAATLLALLFPQAGLAQQDTGDLAAPAAGAMSLDAPEEQLKVLALSLNGRQMEEDTTLAARNGIVMVPADDLRKWRLRVPATPPEIVDGQSFIPLAAISGLTWEVDEAAQRLLITAPADSFETTVLAQRTPLPKPSPAARTAFLNYDVSLQHSPGRTIQAAFLQMGASDDRGLVANTMTLGNALNGSGVVRLDTYYLRDDPEGLHRLTIGDGFTRGSSWSAQVRMGGIRYGTAFDLQPNFLPFPTPAFGGRASIPSNVEIYVNNVLNYQSSVREGPFSLDRLPVVSGSGQAALVVRDALGVEQRIVSNYYVSTSLLRPGLSDFSVEAGAERQNYGDASFDYGRAFASGSYRRGLTSKLTVETRGEAARDLQGGGVGLVTVLGNLGEIGAVGAVSHSDNGSGYLYRVTASRVSSNWSFSLSYQRATPDYAQLGLVDTRDRSIRELQASSGLSLGKQGSVTGSFTYLRLADGTNTRIANLRYNRPLFGRAYIDIFGLRSWDDRNGTDTIAGVSLSLSYGSRSTAYAQADTRNREIQVQRGVPDDTGFGYRVLVRQGETDQQQANLLYRGRAIELTAEAAQYRGQLAERLQASGGFIVAGGSVIPTRRLSDGFAIVEVPGQANVTVLQEHRPVATTNGRGLAIVTHLRPYENNRISVSPDKVELDATIRQDTMMIVPRFLSGVLAKFDVTDGRAGSLVVLLPDGRPLEAGTPIVVPGREDRLVTGFDGELFLDNIIDGQELIAERGDGRCRVRVPVAPKDEVLPRLGPVTCVAETAP